MTTFTTPVGRLVAGHPMTFQNVKDNNNKQVFEVDGVTPVTELYFAIAIKKGAEQTWGQTPWGQEIYNAGVTGWPNGEHGALTFAWKMMDGDSAVPNRKGNIPNTREGFPGHWILSAKTRFPIQCCHNGNYSPINQIKNEKEIKKGDYVRAQIDVKGNAPSESPGVYMNPKLFELIRAGVEIISANAPDAEAAFGSVAAVMPDGALVDNAVAQTATTAVPPGTVAPTTTAMPGTGAAPPPPPNPPVTEFLDPANMLIEYDGKQYTEAQLLGFKWTPAQIQSARDAMG